MTMTLAQIKKNERQVMLNGIDQIQNATETSDVNFMPSVLGTLLSNFDQYQARYIEPNDKDTQTFLKLLTVLKGGANVLDIGFIKFATLSFANYTQGLNEETIPADNILTPDERDKDVEELDTAFKALFGNPDGYTRKELLNASDTFGVHVNAFTKTYGDDYRNELTDLDNELANLKNVIDDPANLGHVRVNGGDWQRATLSDYVEMVQGRIYDLYI